MISAIIVDDEFKSAELAGLKLKRFCPQVAVQSIFTQPEKALEWLEKNTPDVAFLDIEMPGINGLKLATKIINLTEVIFVTAHQKYLLEALRLTAFDYLLKPIDENELVQCMNRLEHKLALKKNNKNNKKLNTQFDKIALPSLEGVHFMNINDIVWVQAENNYSIFYFADKKKMTISKTLKQVEEALEGYTFFRTHKSYLINLSYISRYIRGEGGTIIMTDGTEIELSRNKKREFLDLFEGV